MDRTLWLDRNFNFDFPSGLLPNMISRLEGTLPRLAYLTHELTDHQLAALYDNKWSIKKHIGHLSETETLHSGRINDILEGKEKLRPAFQKRPESEIVDYNAYTIEILLKQFAYNRARFVDMLQKLSDEVQNTKLLHPRLNVFMRPIDIAYFAAEHDDHHLVYINDIIQRL